MVSGAFSVASNSLENHFSQTSLKEVASLSSSQAQMDGLVSGFVEQSTNWRSVAAMMAGGMAYRLGKTGVMALSGASQAAPVLGLVSRGVGLASEVSVFEGVGGILSSSMGAGFPRPGEWTSPLQESFFQRWRTSFLQFGMLKLGGAAALGQNVFVQHLIQDTAMVAGHQMTSYLSLTSSPEGSLAQQYLNAEAMNLQMGTSMGLTHFLAPGVTGLERSLELSYSNQENPSLWQREAGRDFENENSAFAFASATTTPEVPDSSSLRESLHRPQLTWSTDSSNSSSAPEGMAYVPGGKFVMGAGDIENAQPVREVEVDGFYMRKTHETNENYERFVSDPEQRREPWALFGINEQTQRLEILDRGKTKREMEQRADWFYRNVGDGTKDQKPWALLRTDRQSRKIVVVERGESQPELLRRKGQLIDEARGRQKKTLERLEVARVNPSDAPRPTYRVMRGIPDKWKASAPSDHPVTNVNLFEAMTFAHAHGGRLPTEAEWEYGMGGGLLVDVQSRMREEEVPLDQFPEWARGREITTRRFGTERFGRYDVFISGIKIFTDPTSSELRELLRRGAPVRARRAFYSDKGDYDDVSIWGGVTEERKTTRSVREASVFNAHGIGDFGNVYDWTMDAHRRSYEGLGNVNPVRPVNLSDLEKWVVLRGGSRIGRYPVNFRLAGRDSLVPVVRYDFIGFRWLVPFP